jgi:hypothetical protein
MPKENQEVSVVEVKAPAQLIELAIEKGNIDLEKLEKLMLLQERHVANEAKKIFVTSFSMAQMEISAVVKDKLNPQTHSKYAGLESIIENAKPVYTKHGFSVIFYEGKPEIADAVRVCADVLHRAGHKETYYYDVPLDGTGIKGNANMTRIHGKSSSVSYGRRYLMCMIWNIATEDDDGVAAGLPVEYITDKERSELTDMAVEQGASLPKLIAYLKVEDLSKLEKKDLPKAKLALAANKARKEKEKKVAK